MPYNDVDADAIYDEALTPWLEELGFVIKRMDQMPTPRAVITELQKKIRQAHFVLVYVPDRNPNVYFEAGFGAALDKFNIVCAPDIEALAFDLASNYALTVGGADRKTERAELLKFVQRLRGFS